MRLNYRIMRHVDSPLIQRLKAALAAKDRDAAEVSRAASLSSSAIRNIFNGKSASPRTETLNKIANELGVSPSWLMTGIGEQWSDNDTIIVDEPSPGLELCGIVEAGAWRDIRLAENSSGRLLPVAEDSRFKNASQFLLRVVGSSMNTSQPIPILDGAIVRCINFSESGLSLKTGQIVVVQRCRNGGKEIETTLKRVICLEHSIELRPESTNPAHETLVLDNLQGTDQIETKIIAIVTMVQNEIDI